MRLNPIDDWWIRRLHLLENTVRHAQASEIATELIYESDSIHLQIKDNGIGFDVDSTSGGFSLMGIQERCDLLSP